MKNTYQLFFWFLKELKNAAHYKYIQIWYAYIFSYCMRDYRESYLDLDT